MPVYVLGYRMHDNIRTMIQRVLDVGTQERVIHHDHNSMLMGHTRNFSNIHKTQGWIAWTFNPYQLRLPRPYHLCNV